MDITIGHVYLIGERPPGGTFGGTTMDVGIVMTGMDGERI